MGYIYQTICLSIWTVSLKQQKIDLSYTHTNLKLSATLTWVRGGGGGKVLTLRPHFSTDLAVIFREPSP